MESRFFFQFQKKNNVTNIYDIREESRHFANNYRPVALLPIFGKIMERLVYVEMQTYFVDNCTISTNELVSKLGDSCDNQLLLVTYKIYSLFNNDFEGCKVFDYFYFFNFKLSPSLRKLLQKENQKRKNMMLL